MPSRQQRLDSLIAALNDRILVFDGAMGTALFKLWDDRAITIADYGGPKFENCHEKLLVHRPEVIEGIHRNYLDAGADIVETDSFGSMPVVLEEFGIADQAYEISRLAAEVGRRACDRYTDKPRFVAGSMGPTTKAISVTGGITFDQLRESYRVQASGLIDGGADLLLLETCNDTLTVKAGVLGALQAREDAKQDVPISVSITIEPMGTMLAGQSAEALEISIRHFPLFSIGMNCATGPAFMTDHIRALAAQTRFRVSCIPNAGIPDPDTGKFPEGPEVHATVLGRFADQGWLNFVGGCCGTTALHVSSLVKAMRGKKPRPVPTNLPRRTLFTGIEIAEVNDETRLVQVGERTNVLGSKKFKTLIAEEKWDEGVEVGRGQVRAGAALLDVSLQSNDRDEVADIANFLPRLLKAVKCPIVIDTTNPKAIELALKSMQGKALINSINLEDGLDRFEAIVPLAKAYGAGLIVGTIDERGMAVSGQEKLEVAQRSFDILTRDFGIPAEDIVFDPLTFPCGTSDEKYRGSAPKTVEGIRLIKAAMPHCKTVLGISNVSFGLPTDGGGRHIMNSVFLHQCVEAGLDLAIVDSGQLRRATQIKPEERAACEAVLATGSDEAIAAFAAFFRGKKAVREKGTDNRTLDQRLSDYIIEGSRDGLVDDLDLKLKELKPLDIINGPLMAGMDVVGKLFNENKMIVAEVLQSAESMKAAVAHLEKFMSKADAAARGTVVLATVKGDVHDIGKSLVNIIFSNNGYKVHDLGIRVLPGTLIEAVRKHNAGYVGLSGLLVKSCQEMITTATAFAEAGLKVPVLVGGAALSKRFAQTRIAPEYKGGTIAYARDAMSGLDILNRLVEGRYIDTPVGEPAAPKREGGGPVSTERSAAVPSDNPIPPIHDLDRHTIEWTGLDDLWSWINPHVLYSNHLGFRGNFAKALERGDEKARDLHAAVEGAKDFARSFVRVHGVWQHFRCNGDGNELVVYGDHGETRFPLPRQTHSDRLCIADYARPFSSGERDTMAMFVVTAGGAETARYAKQLQDQGNYLRSIALRYLVLETAEAAAERLHADLRASWGFPDGPEVDMQARHKAHYRGKRFSFGYPACPDLALQRPLFALLKPEEIGCHLTDGDMMDPEASVSAIVFHHPSAKYFAVREDESGPAAEPA